MTNLNVLAPVLGDVSVAASNTTRIQALLDAGGGDLIGSGVAYINNSLVLRNKLDTKDVELRLAPGTVKPLVVNTAYLATPQTVTLAWTAGREATVTKTAHGLVEGQAVWLRGANQPQYLGVFRIVDVPTANTFVIRLELTPTTAPTGTVTMVLADQNVTLKGKFDYDWPNNNDGSASVNSHAVVLVGIDHLDADVTASNAFKYGLCVSAVADYRIKALFPTNRSDGVKVYGPAFRGQIDGVDGLVGDDLISFQPLEAAAFLGNATSFGPIVTVRGGNIFSRGSTDGGQGALVFYGNKDGYVLDDVRLVGVHGETNFGGVCVTNNNDLTTGQTATLGSIRVDDITIKSKRPPAFMKQNASGALVVCENLDIGLCEARAVIDVTDNSLGSLFWLPNFCTARNLRLRIVTTDSTYGSAGNTWAVRLDGFYSNLEIERPHINAHASLRLVRPNAQTGIADLCTIRGGYIKADHIFTLQSTGVYTNKPSFVLDGVRTQALCIINAQIGCDLIVRNCDINGASNGIARAQGTSAVDLRASGNVLRGTSPWWVIVSGTPTLNAKSDEISLDVSATGILKAQGNRCYNTNAALGTLGVAGPVIADAANWRLQSDPTKFV